MRQILLVSATPFEIEATQKFLREKKPHLPVTTVITGVGMVHTAFQLGKLFILKPDLVINAGIAGSFGKFKIGEVVSLTADCFSELGAEDDDSFLDISELGFGTAGVSLQPYKNEVTDKLPTASGITVNTTHGNAESIRRIVARHHPDVETMESAAFMHAVSENGWSAIQLRAISNQVEKRNKAAWDIPLAIKNLNAVLIDLLTSLDAN